MPIPFFIPTWQSDKIATLVKAANVNVEAYWPTLFAKLLEKRSVEDLVSNIGSGTVQLGLVKLADFGVAMRVEEAAACHGDAENPNVVGTPYWMAPEVIEMSGISPASDIWSVGCTVIELLTTKPPYFDLQPMPALFRIVQDDMPPIPENVSAATSDFLHLCFRKVRYRGFLGCPMPGWWSGMTGCFCKGLSFRAFLSPRGSFSMPFSRRHIPCLPLFPFESTQKSSVQCWDGGMG
ncbi:unnamed protein product [Closterium sp. NIES-53]